MILNYISPIQIFPSTLTYILHCLLSICAWISHRYFKHDMSHVNTSSHSSHSLFHLWSLLWQIVLLFPIIHSLPPSKGIIHLYQVPCTHSAFLGKNIPFHSIDTRLSHRTFWPVKCEQKWWYTCKSRSICNVWFHQLLTLYIEKNKSQRWYSPSTWMLEWKQKDN